MSQKNGYNIFMGNEFKVIHRLNVVKQIQKYI